MRTRGQQFRAKRSLGRRGRVLGNRRGGLFLAPLLMVAVLNGCGEDLATQQLGGIVRSPAPQVGEMSVPRARDGAEHALKAEADHVLLVYFGYTACPDVCPTTMADLSAALEDLGDKADDVQVAMITIDPDRDSHEILSGYVGHFAEDGYALRTDDAQVLRSVADALGADYSVETTADGDVEVGHTAFLYAVDEDGKLLVTWAFGTPPAEIERDLAILLARMKA